MKSNLRSRSGHSNLSKLDEIGRRNLVGKTKAQSPERFNKRMSYKPLSYRDISFEDLLENDLLVARISIGKYISTIAFKGVIKDLIEIVKKQQKPYLTLQSVIRALTYAIDKTDIFVDCSCDDFKYRYAYWATYHGYKYGKPETRKADVRNPGDNIGSTCKHLSALLSNKRWLVKTSSIVNDYIKKNLDAFIDEYQIDPDLFIVNPNQIPKKIVEPEEEPELDVEEPEEEPEAEEPEEDEEELELNK